MDKIISIAGGFDKHDIWDSTLSIRFDIYDVLDARYISSIEELALNEEGYYSLGVKRLASAMLEGEITPQELIYAGTVLTKYVGLLRFLGHYH